MKTLRQGSVQAIILIIISFITLNAQTRIIPFSTNPSPSTPAGNFPGYINATAIANSAVGGSPRTATVDFTGLVSNGNLLTIYYNAFDIDAGNYASPNVNPTSGWTLGAEDSLLTPSHSGIMTGFFWKISNGTETTVDVTATYPVGYVLNVKAIGFVFDSVNTSSPLEDITSGGYLNASQDTVYSSEVTSTVNNTLVVCVLNYGNDAVNGFSTMSGFVENFDGFTGAGSPDATFTVNSQTKTTAGVVGAQLSYTTPTTGFYRTYTFVLKPIP